MRPLGWLSPREFLHLHSFQHVLLKYSSRKHHKDTLDMNVSKYTQ